MADQPAPPPTQQHFVSKFIATFGFDEATKEWACHVDDAESRAGGRFKAPNMNAAVEELRIRMQKRHDHNIKFPPPEPNRIITLDQAVRHNGRNGR